MNGEGGIGEAEEDFGYLRGEFVTGYELGSPFPGGYYPDISLGFAFPYPQTFYELPPLGTGPTAAETGDSADEVAGDSALPDTETFPSVFETDWVPHFPDVRVPGGIYETNRAPTDWERVYDEYVVLNEPEIEVDVPVHHTVIDWGVEVASQVFGGILDPVGIGSAIRTAYAPASLTGGVTGLPSLGQQTTLRPATVGATTMPACGPTGPKYGKICLATGEITPLRRRRRRRLLTSSDIKDLSALKSIVGGPALQAAVVQAVRR